MDASDQTRGIVLSRVQALVAECAMLGWDGNGAEPISQDAAILVAKFIRALPEGSPLPELAPEPDGSISLDWIETPSRLLSVSVGISDRLACAWIDDGKRGSYVAPFGGHTIPPEILEHLKRF